MHFTNIENNNEISRIDRIKGLIKSDHMNAIEKDSIFKICEQYMEIFFLEGDKLTHTNAIEHKIRLKSGTQSIYKRPYRLPYSQQAEINKQIIKMEIDDIIRPSLSPWNAPLLLVRKKMDNSGIQKYRVVVDFRKLNEVTVNEFHPLPSITEILDKLGGCTLFSVIDFAQGFYQIPLAKESREYTAISTLEGHWEFNRLTMGMKQSPSLFAKLMATVLSGLIGLKCLVYLDDIIIFGKSLEDHNNKLIDVFERLRINNLKIEPSKCNLLKRECLYLFFFFKFESP